ncbi:MAG: hypothetical protein PQJ60_07445, partial [Spirochaetales bacterium]|nr:hypothetical protein [Spirochaetales bacterium]
RKKHTNAVLIGSGALMIILIGLTLIPLLAFGENGEMQACFSYFGKAPFFLKSLHVGPVTFLP